MSHEKTIRFRCPWETEAPYIRKRFPVFCIVSSNELVVLDSLENSKQYKNARKRFRVYRPDYRVHDVSVFKNLCFRRFRPSTLIRKASVFESLHLGRRFRKPPFSWVKVSIFSIVLVWTIGENAYKSMRFQTKTD